MLAVMFDWAKNPDMDLPARLDEALEHLDSGLPL
jgi:hypothetical protein